MIRKIINDESNQSHLGNVWVSSGIWLYLRIFKDFIQIVHVGKYLCRYGLFYLHLAYHFTVSHWGFDHLQVKGLSCHSSRLFFLRVDFLLLSILVAPYRVRRQVDSSPFALATAHWFYYFYMLLYLLSP